MFNSQLEVLLTLFILILAIIRKLNLSLLPKVKIYSGAKIRNIPILISQGINFFPGTQEFSIILGTIKVGVTIGGC